MLAAVRCLSSALCDILAGRAHVWSGATLDAVVTGLLFVKDLGEGLVFSEVRHDEESNLLVLDVVCICDGETCYTGSGSCLTKEFCVVKMVLERFGQHEPSL